MGKNSRFITNTTTPKTIKKSCYKCNMTFENADYNNLFLPKCRGCNRLVENEAVSDMDGKLKGKWHIECFHCQVIKLVLMYNM
jgi:flavoprotein